MFIRLHEAVEGTTKFTMTIHNQSIIAYKTRQHVMFYFQLGIEKDYKTILLNTRT